VARAWARSPQRFQVTPLEQVPHQLEQQPAPALFPQQCRGRFTSRPLHAGVQLEEPRRTAAGGLF